MEHKATTKVAMGLLLAIPLSLVIFVVPCFDTVATGPHRINQNFSVLPNHYPSSFVSYNFDNYTQQPNLILHNYVQKNLVCQYVDYCSIRCIGGSLEDVLMNIQEISDNVNDCLSSYRLSLLRTEFPSNTIEKGWLGSLSASVQTLIISNTNLQHLGYQVFAGFFALRLSLMDTKIRTLKKDSFENSSLVSFTFDFYALTRTNIELDVFSSTASTIQDLSFTYSLVDMEVLNNLTGVDSYFSNLEAVYLRYNSISRIEQNFFSAAPGLRAIYLSFSGIKEIEPGAFQRLENIKLIDISNNNLHALPDGLFSNFDLSTIVNISSNPLKCNCSLAWLISYFEDRNLENFPECTDGSSWKSIKDLTNCSSTPSPTDSSPSTLPDNMTSLSTPAINDDYIFTNIECRRLLSDEVSNSDDLKYILQSASFKKKNIKYNIYGIKDSSKYSLQLEGRLKQTDYLIWINVKNESDNACSFNISQSVELNLLFDSTYTLCLASNDTIDEFAITIQDCSAVSTLPEWSQRAWINNKQKIAVLSTTILTTLLILIISNVIIYCIIRNKPELIKGNKRVLILKKGNEHNIVKSHDISVFNKYHNRKTSCQSFSTNVEGYLMPKVIDSDYPGWYGKTYDTVQYIRKDDEKYDKVYEPPPLPPNHP